MSKGKRAAIYLEVMKRRGAYIFLMKQVPVDRHDIAEILLKVALHTINSSHGLGQA